MKTKFYSQSEIDTDEELQAELKGIKESSGGGNTILNLEKLPSGSEIKGYTTGAKISDGFLVFSKNGELRKAKGAIYSFTLSLPKIPTFNTFKSDATAAQKKANEERQKYFEAKDKEVHLFQFTPPQAGICSFKVVEGSKFLPENNAVKYYSENFGIDILNENRRYLQKM